MEEFSLIFWLAESEHVRGSPGEQLSQALLAVSPPLFFNILTRSVLTITP